MIEVGILLLYYHITILYYNITWWFESSFSRLKFSLYIGVEGDKAGDIGPKATSNLVKLLSCVWLFVTPRTIAYHAPLPMGFSNPGIEPGSPALQTDGRFTIWATREAQSSNLTATDCLDFILK